MLTKRLLCLLAPTGFALSGCASTSPKRSYAQVDTMVSERTEGAVHLSNEQSAATIKETTGALLKEALTPERAVHLSLLNSPALKAKMEELGIAQAELVQAGLIENPVVHASWRFPNGGGATGTGRELGISMNFLDLLTLPLKRKLAAGQLEQAKFHLGKDILDLAADVRTAFYEWASTGQQTAIHQQAVESLEAAATLAQRQRQAGNLSRLDLAVQRAALEEARVELVEVKTRAVTAQERLSLLMGVSVPVDGHGETPELSALPKEDPALEPLETAALAGRWDLLAARREPSVLKQTLRVERLNLFSGLAVGIDSEREFDGAKGAGPSVEFPIPIFDRRQASKAKIRAQLRRSLSSIEALELEVRWEVRVAHARLLQARKKAQAYGTRLLPLKRQIAEETLKNYNFMLLGVYRVLEVRRDQLEAENEYIDALKDYWVERAALERALGGAIPPDAATVPEELESDNDQGEHHEP